MQDLVWPPVATIPFDSDILPVNEHESHDHRYLFQPVERVLNEESFSNLGSPYNFRSAMDEKASPLHQRMCQLRTNQRMTTAVGSNRMVDPLDEVHEDQLQVQISWVGGEQLSSSSNDDNVNLYPNRCQTPGNEFLQNSTSTPTQALYSQDQYGQPSSPTLGSKMSKQHSQRACCTLI